MQKPKISVIMPVYNTAQFVWEAIESILTQSFSDFEFIIIDDGSTDWSSNICEKYAEKDKRIQFFQNKENMWISFTRNRLITLSQGGYIATQDSDDISQKNRLAICFSFLENNKNYWAVSWNNILINEDWKKVWTRKYSDDIDKVLLKKSPLSNPSSVFRKSSFLKVWWYDKNLDYWEDYDLWLKLYASWFKLKNLDDFFLYYRLRAWQTKSSHIKKTLENTIFIQKRAVTEYWLERSFWDSAYIILEQILLYLPSYIVTFLFQKIEYKKL